MSIAEVIALGLINWIATTIIVESEIFRPMREAIQFRRVHKFDLPLEMTDGQRMVISQYERRTSKLWEKAAYFVGCHMCTGTWVGLAEAVFIGSIFSGFVGIVASGLLFKAIGHLTLELVALGRSLRGGDQ